MIRIKSLTTDFIKIGMSVKKFTFQPCIPLLNGLFFYSHYHASKSK